MGVTGSGKSTVAALLAERLGWPFLDADTLHPAANVEKMRSGIPLTDADRGPWLQAVAQRIADRRHAGIVVACSALKRAYRELLSGRGTRVLFVHLQGSAQTIARRLEARQGHYMPPALLASQLATLEAPSREEPAITIAIEAEPAAIVESISTALMRMDAT
jgi:carbohydrate kinase (thermoresistant glucokinase family)